MSRIFEPFTTPLDAIEDLLVVSASAGTGKTWMITHLAARWLLEGDHRPSELLLVTFSKNAASELRSRLRQRLEEIGDALASLDQPDEALDVPWIAAMREFAASAGHAEVRRRHREILSSLDDVHARTIHSFIGALAHENEASMSDGNELRRRAVNEVLTRRTTSGDDVIFSLLDRLEGDASGTTPAAAILAERLYQALSRVESAGGLAASRVVLWHDESTASSEQALVVQQLLTECSDRLVALRSLDETTTFDALISDAHHLVTSADASLHVPDQFSLIMIDEFQDTDILQWEIFDRLFRRCSSPRPVIVVGDPKQSIYAFRGADVSVFSRVDDEARREALGRRCFHLTLETNYRSSEGLLNQLDALFTRANKIDWVFADADHDVRFESVVPSPAHSGQPGLFAIRRAPESESLSDEILHDVRDVVVDLTTTRGVPASDIAILCARRSSLTRLRHVLERSHVASVTIGTTSVWLSVAATQLRVLLWILCDPFDSRRSSLAATTWFSSLGPSDLVRLSRDLNYDGVASLQRRALSGDVLGKVLAQRDGERNWTDIEHLFELLAVAADGPLGAHRLLGHFDRAVSDAEAGDDADDSAQRRIESEAPAVRLMTIHAAKGLQFPVVLTPDLEVVGPRRGVASWTTENGRSIEAATVLGAPPLSPFAHSRQVEEARRLIYVALTRAERILVAWSYGTKGEWNALVSSRDDALVSWPTMSDVGTTLVVPEDLTFTRGADLDLGRPEVRIAPRLVQRIRRWSYSSLAPHHENETSPSLIDVAGSGYDAAARAEDVGDDEEINEQIIDEERVEAFDGLRGPLLGNAVHRVFELAVGRLTSSQPQDIAAIVERSWREHALGHPSPSVPASFVQLLGRPMGDLFGDESLGSLAGQHRSSCEMRFTLPLFGEIDNRLSRLCSLVVEHEPEGPYREYFRTLSATSALGHELFEGFLTGSIDLVAQIGSELQPRFVIVDYKTNLLRVTTSYSPENLRHEMTHSGYPLQALLYSVALHRYLRGRLANYDPHDHLGGLCYYYVRGALDTDAVANGLANWLVSPTLVARASDLLDGVLT